MCRAGRAAFTLAGALPRAEIVGVDLSIDMLSQAAAARSAAEPSVRRRVSLVEGDMAGRLVTDFASHVYFPAELELLFLSAGFEIAQQYGDYRFVPVDRTSLATEAAALESYQAFLGPSGGRPTPMCPSSARTSEHRRQQVLTRRRWLACQTTVGRSAPDPPGRTRAGRG